MSDLDEEVVFGHLSTGASNDLEQATNWARRMITEYGMSPGLGPVSYADTSSDVFLGRDLMSRKDYSEKKAQQIDDEVADMLNARYGEARDIMVNERDKLDRIAEALLERETLETSDLDCLMRGDDLPPMRPATTADPDAGEGQPPGSEDLADSNLPDPEPFPS